MPTPQITAFAHKSGKSEAEVEKMWDAIKASLIKQGESEASTSFYPKLVGILKKNLKLEHTEEIDSALFQIFEKEKEDKKKKAKDTLKGKDDKDSKDPEDDDDTSTLDGDYNTYEMLRAVIETIKLTDDEEGEAGPENELEFGLEIIYEIADQLPEETAELIVDALFQYYDVDEDDVDAASSDDDDDAEEESINEMINLIYLPEAMNPVQRKRMRYLKAKRRKQMGKRGTSMTFKRNYKFDTKKKRFVKRGKPVSIAQMRKKARTLKRVVRKGATKAKAKRTKRKLQHVRNPYKSASKK